VLSLLVVWHDSSILSSVATFVLSLLVVWHDSSILSSVATFLVDRDDRCVLEMYGVRTEGNTFFARF